MKTSELNAALEKMGFERNENKYVYVLVTGEIELDGVFESADLLRIIEVLRKFTPKKT
jgi:hypothetical protein